MIPIYLVKVVGRQGEYQCYVNQAPEASDIKAILDLEIITLKRQAHTNTLDLWPRIKVLQSLAAMFMVPTDASMHNYAVVLGGVEIGRVKTAQYEMYELPR